MIQFPNYISIQKVPNGGMVIAFGTLNLVVKCTKRLRICGMAYKVMQPKASTGATEPSWPHYHKVLHMSVYENV